MIFNVTTNGMEMEWNGMEMEWNEWNGNDLNQRIRPGFFHIVIKKH